MPKPLKVDNKLLISNIHLSIITSLSPDMWDFGAYKPCPGSTDLFQAPCARETLICSFYCYGAACCVVATQHIVICANHLSYCEHGRQNFEAGMQVGPQEGQWETWELKDAPRT